MPGAWSVARAVYPQSCPGSARMPASSTSRGDASGAQAWPASSNSTDRAGSWLRRAARASPAEPPPDDAHVGGLGQVRHANLLTLQVAGSAIGTTGGL